MLSFLIGLYLLNRCTATDNNFTPVIYLPGYYGSTLYGLISDISLEPPSCLTSDLPLDQFFPIFSASVLPPCAYDLLAMSYNSTTNEFSSIEGVEITTMNFGSFQDIDSVNYYFRDTLLSWGYTEGVPLFGAPYDYRFMSVKSLESIGFIKEMISLVEYAFKVNNNHKVMLIGHSNGKL
jgi:hypothetical protein